MYPCNPDRRASARRGGSGQRGRPRRRRHKDRLGHTDWRHFVKRIVEIGLQRDGYNQILKGAGARRTDRHRRRDFSK